MVGRQERHPACKKTEWWGAGVVICLERGAELHMAQLMPLPLTVSCFSKIQIRNSCNKYTWWILKAFISLTELTSLRECSARQQSIGGSER